VTVTRTTFWARTTVGGTLHHLYVTYHPWQVDLAVKAVYQWRDQGLISSQDATKVCMMLLFDLPNQ